MIRVNEEIIRLDKYPDRTLLIKCKKKVDKDIKITWLYESDNEIFALICITKHLKTKNNRIELFMPYTPNGRMDRVKNTEDVFTLKYFAEIINDLDFDSVTVLDPHSSVSEALIDNIIVETPEKFVGAVVREIGDDELTMFYPDEGAMKRYSSMFDYPYAFGIKKREWETGQICGLDVSGMAELIQGKKILIVDDISSRGGTFYHSAKKLKELGAKEIYLYVSHCENTILDGEVLTSGLIEKVFTTNSIFTKSHEKITVMEV